MRYHYRKLGHAAVSCELSYTYQLQLNGIQWYCYGVVIRQIYLLNVAAKGKGSGGVKTAKLYAWVALQSLPEEMVISPCLLDFLEKALETIPITPIERNYTGKLHLCILVCFSFFCLLVALTCIFFKFHFLMSSCAS